MQFEIFPSIQFNQNFLPKNVWINYWISQNPFPILCHALVWNPCFYYKKFFYSLFININVSYFYLNATWSFIFHWHKPFLLYFHFSSKRWKKTREELHKFHTFSYKYLFFVCFFVNIQSQHILCNKIKIHIFCFFKIHW